MREQWTPGALFTPPRSAGNQANMYPNSIFVELAFNRSGHVPGSYTMDNHAIH